MRQFKVIPFGQLVIAGVVFTIVAGIGWFLYFLSPPTYWGTMSTWGTIGFVLGVGFTFGVLGVIGRMIAQVWRH
jgi:hypothetical protein